MVGKRFIAAVEAVELVEFGAEGWYRKEAPYSRTAYFQLAGIQTVCVLVTVQMGVVGS